MSKTIPHGPCLVVLVGPSGAGKSTLAAKLFPANEIVSSDALRVEMLGDAQRQDRNDDIFREFERRITAKIKIGQRVVADACHIRDSDRFHTAQIGIDLGVPTFYLLINRSVESKLQHAGWRKNVRIYEKGKDKGTLIEVNEQTFAANLPKMLAGDPHEFALDGVHSPIKVIDMRENMFAPDVRIAKPLPRVDVLHFLNDAGFANIRVVGDVHGNLDGIAKVVDSAPPKTFFLFLGDVVDYGRHTLETSTIVTRMVRQGLAANLRGNHERKIYKWVMENRPNAHGEVKGFQGDLTHGNSTTTNQLLALLPEDRAAWENEFIALVDMSPDTIQIGPYLFAHGAAHPDMWDNTTFRFPRNSKFESLALFGETTGKKDASGMPERIYDWVNRIDHGRTVVVGHAIRSVDEVMIQRNDLGGRAIFLDTGSSKDLDGRPGHLSWMDLHIQSRRGLVELNETFGHE